MQLGSTAGSANCPAAQYQAYASSTAAGTRHALRSLTRASAGMYMYDFRSRPYGVGHVDVMIEIVPRSRLEAYLYCTLSYSLDNEKRD